MKKNNKTFFFKSFHNPDTKTVLKSLYLKKILIVKGYENIPPQPSQPPTFLSLTCSTKKIL